MVRKIVGTKDPVLRLVSKPVTKFDKKIAFLGKDLIDTLKVQKDPEGVGLAACQIGKSIRMFAMVDGKDIRVIVNPNIIKISQNKISKKKNKQNILNHTLMEGCLSVPYYYGPIERPQKLTLKYQDQDGKVKTEEFEGLPAQIVQHEVDHLNGVLFVDKLIEQNKSLYKIKGDEWEKVEL
jgi:peptide deformylase